MKKIVWIALFLMFFITAGAQVIPSERRVDWKDMVNEFVYKTPQQTINILDFGGVPNGKTDNSTALTNALSALKNKAGIIFFPPGNYLFIKPVSLPDSVELKGAGADSTTLRFFLNGSSENSIQITGTASGDFIPLKGGYEKGSSYVLTDSASAFSKNNWIELVENNGSWNTVPADWAVQSVGQIMQVLRVSDDTVFLVHPLRFNYSDSLLPRIRSINPVRNVSLACLKIVRADQPETGGGFNVFFDFAVNSRMMGVESDTSSGSHVYISRSSQIQIEGCYFHHAFLYDGVSTHGYGVTLADHTGSCLVANNIFVHLRHAMMVKTGANGNVFAYNYSRDPFRSETISDLSGDISLHGHYAYANLFEGNIVQNIIIDHYWGPSGPWNTFFRNRAELWGIIMTQSDTTETSRQNFVGNECTDNAFYHGQFVLTGSDHFVYANNILGTLIPSSSGELTDSSYYLSSPPDFWDNDLSWPVIGPPYKLGAGTIPAKKRFETGEIFTVCPETVTAIKSVDEKNIQGKIWPVPVRKELNLIVPDKQGNQRYRVRIISMQGETLFEQEFEKSLIRFPVNGILKPGWYLLTVSVGNSSLMIRKFLYKP